MQVATLFREATSLLDPEMDESSHLKIDGCQENIGMKSEPPQDDGYETAGGGESDMLKGQNQHHQPSIESHHHANQNMVSPNVSSLVKEEEPMVKYDMPDDPYSFVDDDHMMAPSQFPPSLSHVPKKRGRKKKIKTEDLPTSSSLGYQSILNCLPNNMKGPASIKMVKERKKHDRFNGMPEEEVSKRTLPDHLNQNLDIVIIGINPGLFAAYKGHHYAGPGNHFWKCLYLSGLTPEPMTADDDYKLLEVGIGFTNMVERATKGSADLTRKEIKEGSRVLLEKLRKFRPKIAVFNGKLIFEVFSGKKEFSFGRQPEMVDGTNTHMWVMPSSSARCAQLPRAADKVPFYAALKKFRDYLNGTVSEIDEKEMVFSYSKLKNFFEPDIKEEEQDGGPYDVEKMDGSLTESLKKEDDLLFPKKKRGRPKKIKDGEQKNDDSSPKPKVEEEVGLPKKKRGRPKKVKSDPNDLAQKNLQQHPNDLSQPSHCFSPPIQSPSMQGFPMYHQIYNQSSRSPLPTNYQSPLQAHGYNQSPQPPSFTHSDLSSEISAAISSEHSPESPALGPPDFEPPASMSEEVSSKSEEKDDECHFPSPQSKKSYSYDDFSTDSDSGVRYNQKQISQDVTSKSLSGLESLVDQIPNIADYEQIHNSGVVGESEPMGSQYSDDSAYMSDYARSHYSPQYNTPNPNAYMQQHSNFSVTSLANSSASDSYSVGSLAGNYPHNYNIMGPPMMEPNPPPIFGMDRACRIDHNTNMNANSSIPYPYPQYSSYPASSSGFYTASHNIHMPSPNYPYATYSNVTYPQPSYLPNHVFDRVKTDRMDFGGYQ